MKFLNKTLTLTCFGLITSFSNVLADECEDFSRRSADLAKEVKVTTSFIEKFDDLMKSASENGNVVYIAYDLTQVVEKLRTRPFSSLNIFDVAYVIIGIASQAPDTSLSAVQNLQTLVDAQASPQLLRPAIVNAYDELNANAQTAAYLRALQFGTMPQPKSINEVMDQAQRNDPDSEFYKGLLHTLLSNQVQDALLPSLTLSGYGKLHRNRVLQEMLYVGYSCKEALSIAKSLPASLVEREILSATYGRGSVTYAADRSRNGILVGQKRMIPYPGSRFFSPKLTYPAHTPLNPKLVVDRTVKYSGEYEVADFAYGEFGNYEMAVRGFYVASAALNLVRQYPRSPVTLRYNPSFFSKRGINDFPAYFRKQLSEKGLSAAYVQYKADTSLSDLPESYGYSWTRDQWLNAYDRKKKSFVRLQSAPASSGYTPVPISTEGGALFPIGRYFFVNKSVWNRPSGYSPEGIPLPAESVEIQKQRYRAITGREPIFIEEDAPNEYPANLHVDTYMVFLPQKNGVPVIGLPDYNEGVKILRSLPEARISEILKERFIVQQKSLRIERDERPRIDIFDPLATGLPVFARFGSYVATYKELSQFDLSADQDAIDREGRWLEAAGFKVFKYPALPSFTQANGFVELTASKATFTTNTFGLREFDAALALQVNRFGYALNLIPSGHGISEGAGFHCLTNENRMKPLPSPSPSPSPRV